jgi:hypothetical protein
LISIREKRMEQATFIQVSYFGDPDGVVRICEARLSIEELHSAVLAIVS